MFEPEKPRNDKTSWGRIAIWVAVAGVGVYFVVSGLIGLISGGS